MILVSMTRIEINPNVQRQVQEPRLIQVVKEIPYGVRHFRRSLKEKKQTSIQEAQEFLLLAQTKLGENNSYFGENDSPTDINHVASGYYAVVYSFHSATRDWVIKLGATHSPMRSYFHPNSPEFAQWYQYGLDIQRTVFKDDLPFLIPEPQTIIHLTGKERETTVILQPLDRGILTKEQVKLLPKEEKQRLVTEYETFHRKYNEMRKEFGMMPDFELLPFIRDTSHFAISQREGSPHLVMHDQGLFDKYAPTPIFYQWNRMQGLMLVRLQERSLRRSP